MVLSLAVSLRYIFWRVTETLDFGSVVELLLGIGLAVAEMYAILVLVLGYVQTLWPLERKPIPMPDDFALWPTVDVYVPTYNEPMSIVRATVLGAIAIDWPPEKMRIYLLDDGRREEFREFAAECGIGYITRATTCTPRPATSTTRWRRPRASSSPCSTATTSRPAPSCR